MSTRHDTHPPTCITTFASRAQDDGARHQVSQAIHWQPRLEAEKGRRHGAPAGDALIDSLALALALARAPHQGEEEESVPHVKKRWLVSAPRRSSTRHAYE